MSNDVITLYSEHGTLEVKLEIIGEQIYFKLLTLTNVLPEEIIAKIKEKEKTNA